MIHIGQITGLVLAGGRGSRMGGVDKGLQLLDGRPLAWHVLERLRPQVGTLAVNAHRASQAYAQFGIPVWHDDMADHPGPLAGFLTGLRHATTPYVAVVPCDTPRLPGDLVARLAQALEQGLADLAMAASPGADGSWQRQPVCCLLRRDLADNLEQALRDGLRKVESWADAQQVVQVEFNDASAFVNANTPSELRGLQASP